VTNWGGYWTEVKLEVLSKYLAGFNNASRSARATVYLDLFGGSLRHTREDNGATFYGSTARALLTDPQFTRLVFWELETQAAALQADLKREFPGDNRYEIVAGDCNVHLQEGLDRVSGLRWAPTFAFIDPKGLEVEWTTLETLSKWRQDRRDRKVEMWILVPEPAFARVLGLKGERGEPWPDQLTRYFGTDEWTGIYQRRQSGEYSPDQTRAEFVNLLRWRLEQTLGYQWTHALKLSNVSDQPVYTMVFATDAKPGNKIMASIYKSARVKGIPELRSQAVALRDAKRRDSRGLMTLFDPPPRRVKSQEYEHIPPWEPPAKLRERVVFDESPSAGQAEEAEAWPSPDGS